MNSLWDRKAGAKHVIDASSYATSQVQLVSSDHEEGKGDICNRTCSQGRAADGFLSPPSSRCLLQAVTQALPPCKTCCCPFIVFLFLFILLSSAIGCPLTKSLGTILNWHWEFVCFLCLFVLNTLPKVVLLMLCWTHTHHHLF